MTSVVARFATKLRAHRDQVTQLLSLQLFRRARDRLILTYPRHSRGAGSVEGLPSLQHINLDCEILAWWANRVCATVRRRSHSVFLPFTAKPVRKVLWHPINDSSPGGDPLPADNDGAC